MTVQSRSGASLRNTHSKRSLLPGRADLVPASLSSNVLSPLFTTREGGPGQVPLPKTHPDFHTANPQLLVKLIMSDLIKATSKMLSLNRVIRKDL